MKAFRFKSAPVPRVLSLILSLALICPAFLTGCSGNKENQDTPASATAAGKTAATESSGSEKEASPSESGAETAATSAPAEAPSIVLGEKDLPGIKSYIDSCVNGPFREYETFPDFISVQQLPAVIFSGSELLLKACASVGLDSFTRSHYEQYLKEHFHPDITLPSNADYIFGYDAEEDSFRTDYEISKRNYRPFSTWLEPELSQNGEDIYFDSYELNYEFVNAETGRDEKDNPLARMVIDGVTVGFSAPIARRDLHLIDHRPLAKTRYTLRMNFDGSYYMVSKTKLGRDEAYKKAASELFNSLEAVPVNANLRGGNKLDVRDWASDSANLLGTLQDGTFIWYVNVLPSTGYYLGAPAAKSAVFNYKLGFGFMKAGFLN